MWKEDIKINWKQWLIQRHLISVKCQDSFLAFFSQGFLFPVWIECFIGHTDENLRDIWAWRLFTSYLEYLSKQLSGYFKSRLRISQPGVWVIMHTCLFRCSSFSLEKKKIIFFFTNMCHRCKFAFLTCRDIEMADSCGRKPQRDHVV